MRKSVVIETMQNLMFNRNVKKKLQLRGWRVEMQNLLERRNRE